MVGEERKRGTNKTLRGIADSRGVLKCALARHTAALVSKLGDELLIPTSGILTLPFLHLPPAPPS